MPVDPMIASALIGGGLSLFSNIFGSATDDSFYQNEQLMQQQYQYSKDLMGYQHDLNSPSQYLKDLSSVGLNEGLIYGKNYNQMQTTLGSSPSGDLSGVVQSKMLAAQLGNIASQTAMNIAKAKETEVNARKGEEEIKNISAQTQHLLTDNEFQEQLINKNLELMDSSIADSLSHSSLNQELILKTHAEWEQVIASTDKIEAETDYINQNRDYLLEQTNLTKLRQIIDRDLANSQLANDAASRDVAYRQAELLIKEGIGQDLDNQVKGIERAFAPLMQVEEYRQARGQTRSLRIKNRMESSKLRVQQSGEAAQKALVGTNVVLNAVQEFVKTAKDVRSVTPAGRAEKVIDKLVGSFSGSE